MSVLGPVLFLLMIGDLDKHVKHSTVSSFADDTRISCAIKSQADSNNLQQDLNLVIAWATKNNEIQ